MNAPATTPAGATRAKNAHLWERHPDDYYIEPRWVSERLFAVEKFEGGVLDPACGMGRIVQAAEAAGLDAYGSDLVQRGHLMKVANAPVAGINFLTDHYPVMMLHDETGGHCANIVSNPPFKHADAFVRRALAITPDKVAMLLPAQWMNGMSRGAWLEETPLQTVWLISPRPSMPPGPVIEAGLSPGGGRVDFAWYVFQRGYLGRPTLRWLRREGGK